MSDHSSAYVFGLTFRTLAKIQKKCPEQSAFIKKQAREIYNSAIQHDFCDYDMHADGALITLGLARKGKAKEDPNFDPSWGDDPNEKVTIYYSDDHF